MYYDLGITSQKISPRVLKIPKNLIAFAEFDRSIDEKISESLDTETY